MSLPRNSRLTSLLLGAALAVGCAAKATPPPSPTPAFVCSARPNPIPLRDTAPGVPMGRIEVRLLSGPFGRNIEKVRLRVIAENVPLGVFAGALSDALGIGVVVTAPLVGVRVGLALPDVEMIELFRVLSHTQGAHCIVHDGRIHIEPTDPTSRFNFDLDAWPPIPETGYHESHLLTMPDSVPPEHFAAYFCDMIASSHGRAVVFGQRVIIDDDKEHVARAQDLLSTWLTPRSERTAPGPAATKP